MYRLLVSLDSRIDLGTTILIRVTLSQSTVEVANNIDFSPYKRVTWVNLNEWSGLEHKFNVIWNGKEGFYSPLIVLIPERLRARSALWRRAALWVQLRHQIWRIDASWGWVFLGSAGGNVGRVPAREARHWYQAPKCRTLRCSLSRISDIQWGICHCAEARMNGCFELPIPVGLLLHREAVLDA